MPFYSKFINLFFKDKAYQFDSENTYFILYTRYSIWWRKNI